MEEQNIAIRLKGFIDHEGLSHSQFADRCDIPRPSLSQILSGRNKKVSDVIVSQIHKAFPQLSILWLMFGEGPMILDNRHTLQNETPDGQNVASDANLFSENLEFAGNDPTFQFDPNLSGLNKPSKPIKASDNKRVEDDLKIAQLQLQIDKLMKNPRKVSHITVYYDDSTFETFYPASK